jgi:ribosomal protein S18 acetylase RimI-like enzyme
MTSGEFVFGLATPDDVNELAAMEKLLFHTDQCSRKSFRHLIRRGAVLLARHSGEQSIAGYGIFLTRKNSSKLRIYSLGVVPTERKSGLGQQLVEMLEEIARKNGCTAVTLEVDSQNTAAIALYRKNGFHQYGFRPGYYQDGGHALLLWKSLTARENHDYPHYASSRYL